MTPSYRAARKHMRDIGIKAPYWNNMVIVAEALDRGIDVSTIRSGRRMVLKHGGKKHFWLLGRSSLNTKLAIKCTELKEVTSSLLRSAGVDAPENAVFGAEDAKRAWRWAEALLPVVVKPNDGLMGRDVHVDIRTWSSFQRAFNRVAATGATVLVERFDRGRDHRVLVVDGKVVAATHRTPANVVGDGSSTVEELVAVKNADRGVVHKKLVLDGTAAEHLQRQNLAFGSVIPEGERVLLRGNANLSTGGDVVDATDSLTGYEIDHIEKAASALPDLRVGGFDVLLPREPGDGSPTIIEVNSNPMISGHHFPWVGQSRDAAGAILNVMFPITARPVVSAIPALDVPLDV